MTRRTLLAAAASLLGPLPLRAEQGAPSLPQLDPRWRFYDSATRRDLSVDGLVRVLASADAVFVGEQHGDPETHRFELALLAALATEAGGRLALGLEMLERDAQPALDSYLAGSAPEVLFVQHARPWPNYSRDYRPLVEWARERRVPVLASNLPRHIASAVARDGLRAIDALGPNERNLAADFVLAPEDPYWERFRQAMSTGHPMPQGAAPGVDTVRRLYEAQCTRDDTMAETIARALGAGSRVLHINGSFHSDCGLGIPARVLWRRPKRTHLRIVKVVPIRGPLAAADASGYGAEADVVVLVPDLGTAEGVPEGGRK